MKQLTIGSLFSGVGGLEHFLLKNKKYTLKYVADPNKYCTAILKYHHPDIPNLGAVSKMEAKDIPYTDIIMGGTSCQGFSDQGLRGGLEHNKSKLFYEFARIIRDKQPKYVVWENVYSATTHKDFAIIKKIFKDIGYEIDFEVFNSREYSSTIQQRRRIILLATRKDLVQVRLDRSVPSIKFNEEMQSLEQRLVSISKSHRSEKTKNGEVIEDKHIGVRINHGIANTLVTGWACTGQSTRNYTLNEDGVLQELTPEECEILMTWPVGYTGKGIINDEVVDIPTRERYRVCGNGVVSEMIPNILRNLTEVEFGLS